MRRLIYLAFLISATAAPSVYANHINWGTSGQHLYAADGETPLPGRRERNETTTGFIQLLWLGPNGVYDGLDSTGDGAKGDDQVIAQSWVGDGNLVFLPDTPGQFDATDNPPSAAYTSGDNSFAIRVFDTVVSDADWTVGNIPTSGFYKYVVFTNPVKVADFYNLWIDAKLTVDIPLSWILSILEPEGDGATNPAGGEYAYSLNKGAAVAAIPDFGWELSQWLVDGEDAGDDNPITVPAVEPGETSTLQAVFARKQYTLTYTAGANGAIDGQHQVVQAVAHGQDGSPVTATPAEGHSFGRWSDNLHTATRTDTTIVNDLAVTAEFAINQYTIIFDSAGGSAVEPITRDYGTPVDQPSSPTRVGHSFAGWNPPIPATMPADDLTLVAQWTVNQYTISFDSAGGSAVDPITQDYGTAVVPPAAPTLVGHTFVGWNPAVPATMPADDLELTAQWTVNQYTITFDSAGGSAVEPITQDYGTPVVPPTDPTLVGHTFAGWNPAVPATMPADDLELTAQWTVNQYTISFDSAGGSAVDPITKEYGTPVVPPANPTLVGHTFTGWEPAVPATMPADNPTLFAQWTVNQYTITFDSASGSPVDPITQDYGTPVTVPNDPTIVGHTFAGWNPAVPETMPAENPTLVAQWTVNQYTITFDSAGGSEVDPITQDYGTPVVPPADPTRVGHTFAGWAPPVPDTMPAENRTLTAQWAINQYTLSCTAGENGSIDGQPQVVQTVVHGQDAAPVTAVPAEGHRFDQWSDGVTTATRTDTNVVDDLDVTAEFEAKWVPTITWPAPAPIVYGTPLSGAQLNAEADTPGTFAYDPPADTVLPAGAHTLRTTFTPADGVNWAAAEATVQLTVIRAALTVTPDADQDKVFGEPDPMLTYTSSGAVGGETPAFTGALARNPGESVGDYEIRRGTLALADNAPFLAANYTLEFTEGVMFAIGKAASTITATGATAYIYTGAPQGPDTADVTGSTGAVTYSYSGTGDTAYGPSADKPTAAGAYQVVATVAADANHHGKESAPLAFGIGKADSTVTATGATAYTYTGAPQGPDTAEVTGSTGAVAYSYSGTGATAYGPSADRPTAAGAYQVVATVAADTNHESAESAPLAFSIGKAILAVTPNAGQSKTFGEDDPVFVYTHEGAVAGETPQFAGTLSRVAGENADDYEILVGTLALADNAPFIAANYTLEFTDGIAFTIGKADSTVTATGDTTYTYTGTPQGPATADATGSTGAVAYSYSGTGATAYGPSVDKPTAAGTYQVVATVAPDANHEGAESAPLAFGIGKAASTVTATGATAYIYTGSPQGPDTADVTGSTGAVAYSYSGTDDTAYGPGTDKPTAAGTYQVVATVAADANHNGAESAPVAFGIGKAALTVTAADRGKTYGEAVVFAGDEFAVAGLVGDDTVAAVTLASEGSAACAPVAGAPYAVVPSDAVGTGLDNYTIAYVNGTLAVARATLTVTANNATRRVVQANPAFSCTPTGLVCADILESIGIEVAYACAADEASEPDNYAINPSGPATTDNYTVTYVAGTLTVTAKQVPTITWPAPDAIVYGTPLDGTQLNAEADTPGTFAYDPPAGTVLPAGTHTLRTTFTPADGDNWTGATATVELTVEQAALAVTAADRGKTYGEAVVFAGDEFTVEGLVGDDTVTAVTLASDGAAACAPVAGAPYAIVPSGAVGAGLDNYAIAYVNGTLAVARAVLTVTANNATRRVGQQNPAFSCTPTGLVCADTLDSIGIEVAYACAADEASEPGDHAIAPSGPETTANYAMAYVAGTLTVTAKDVPTITWPAPDAIVYGTALDGTQLKAGADTPGTFAYDPPAGTVLPAGTHTLTATFTPADGVNWAATEATVELTVVAGAAMWLRVAAGDGTPATALAFGEAETAAEGEDGWDALAAPGQVARLFCPFPSVVEPRQLARDFRPIPADPADITRWRLEVGAPSLPQGRSVHPDGTATPEPRTLNPEPSYTLTWNVDAAVAGRELWLQALVDERPVGFPVDMKVVGELAGVAPGTVFEIVYGELRTHTVELRQGWNAVGTPLLGLASLGELGGAPEAAGLRLPGWRWGAGGFERVGAEAPLLPETGYLLHCVAESATLVVVGLPPDGVFPLAAGWNLISSVGPMAAPVGRAAGPAAWKWEADSQSHRPAGAFEPGQAYWWHGEGEGTAGGERFKQ